MNMSNQQILEKAIQQAIDGGWRPGWQDRRPVVRWGAQYAEDYDVGEGVMISGYHAKSNASMWFFPLKELIYDHDFAKALWGDGLVTFNTRLSNGHVQSWQAESPAWQYHLQMMVIDADPIAYLEANI